MDACGVCGVDLDYNGVVYKLDLQEWLLNQAMGEKLSLCSGCGEKLRAFLGLT